jgi:hypothetical protein
MTDNKPPVEMKATDLYYITMFHQAIIEYGENIEQDGDRLIETIFKECMRKVPKHIFMKGLVNHLANENNALPEGNPELRRA